MKIVKTYLQSGNVIFNSNVDDKAKISQEIEEKINQSIRFPVNVIIRTNNELECIVENNPFTKDLKSEIDKLYVTFLKEKLETIDLDINKDENEKFEVSGNEIYLYLPNGYARSKLNNNVFEKSLKPLHQREMENY